jgi:hypothetical protein
MKAQGLGASEIAKALKRCGARRITTKMAADMTTHPIPTAALDDRLGFRLILWTISASTEEPQ